MTTGFFTSEREPALSLEAIGPEGSRSCDAIIDTGFTGELTLPPAWIEELGLPQSGVEEMILADGRVSDTLLYDGYVIVDDEPCPNAASSRRPEGSSSASTPCRACTSGKKSGRRRKRGHYTSSYSPSRSHARRKI